MRLFCSARSVPVTWELAQTSSRMEEYQLLNWAMVKSPLMMLILASGLAPNFSSMASRALVCLSVSFSLSER